MVREIYIPKTLISRILKSRKIFLLAFNSGEVDEISALYSLNEAMLYLGIKSESWLPEPIPQGIDSLFPAKFLKKIKFFMPNSQSGQDSIPAKKSKSAKNDLCIFLGNPKGKEEFITNAPVFNQAQRSAIFYNSPVIQEDFFTLPYSTTFCEMVFLLFQNAKWKITPAIAKALYTGIISKTEGLQKRRTTSQTHEIVAHLLEKGTFSANDIYHTLFEKKTIPYLDFLKKIIENTELSYNNQIVLVDLDKNRTQEYPDTKFIKHAANFLYMSMSIKLVIFFIYHEGQLNIFIFSRNPALRKKIAQGWQVINHGKDNFFQLTGTPSQTIKILKERLSNIFKI